MEDPAPHNWMRSDLGVLSARSWSTIVNYVRPDGIPGIRARIQPHEPDSFGNPSQEFLTAIWLPQ